MSDPAEKIRRLKALAQDEERKRIRAEADLDSAKASLAEASAALAALGADSPTQARELAESLRAEASHELDKLIADREEQK